MIVYQVGKKEYLSELKSFREETYYVKVITGVRRCGKSTSISTLMDNFTKVLRGLGVS
jgi:predicted AAA+ superfamily ATPase